MNIKTKSMIQRLMLFIFLSVISGKIIAQDDYYDRLVIGQQSSKYPNLTVKSYEGILSGHPYVRMQNYGGTASSAVATPNGRILGTVIYAGYDGTKDVQVARISVNSTDTFAPNYFPAKMIFSIGGTAACCGIERMTIDGISGNVGIGTTAPRNKLDVNGTIRSKEVKVEATPWPDYVFFDTYQLRTLEETADYISENGHLPEVPTAAEVAENGINLGEMNALLLKKIEELTLHLIDLQVQIDELKK